MCRFSYREVACGCKFRPSHFSPSPHLSLLPPQNASPPRGRQGAAAGSWWFYNQHRAQSPPTLACPLASPGCHNVLYWHVFTAISLVALRKLLLAWDRIRSLEPELFLLLQDRIRHPLPLEEVLQNAFS